MKLSRKLIILSVTGLLPFPVLAGNLDAPSAPTNVSSAMYSLQSICDRLQSGATGSQVVFTEPTAGPAGTGCTLNTLMSQAPVLDNINGATPAEVVSGKTFWGLAGGGNWGLQTGTAVASSAGANVTGTDGNLVMTIPDGLYSGKTCTATDTDLATGNIKSGINLFGVTGTLISIGGNVQDTTTGDATVADIATGKKAWVDGVEITGTVPVGANVAGTAGNLVITIPDGLYSGSKTATANDADLIASNIKNGINLFGMVGNYNPLIATGTATVAQVLGGQTFSNASSSGLTGTMANNGAVTLTPTTTNQTIVAGYHNGSGTVIGDADLVTGNIKNGVTLFGVSGKPEVVDTTEATNPATAANLLSGKKAFVNGVAITGTVPVGANVAGTVGNLVITIPDGLYSGSKTATANDADLIATNVRSGINIFGVPGDSNVVNTSTGDATAAEIATGKKAWVDGIEIIGSASGGGSAVVPKTGQTISYAAGDDGDLEKGVALPSPRFTDSSNGTVTDNLTGLIWLKNANCFGTKNWTNALSSANGLANGACGLTDGSTAGQWRLPNVKELQSLIDFSISTPPALPTGHPFSGVQAGYYWSSTTNAGVTTFAWVVHLTFGYVANGNKTGPSDVWPLRGGQ